MTPLVRHKHVQLDQRKLDRARRTLGARTETETLDRGLDIVVAEADIEKMKADIRVKLDGLGHPPTTSFWTLPLVLRLEHTRALAWGDPAGVGGRSPARISIRSETGRV